jgi:hypothetical protein
MVFALESIGVFPCGKNTIELRLLRHKSWLNKLKGTCFFEETESPQKFNKNQELEEVISKSFQVIKRVIFLENECAKRPSCEHLKANKNQQNEEEANKERNVNQCQ